MMYCKDDVRNQKSCDLSIKWALETFWSIHSHSSRVVIQTYIKVLRCIFLSFYWYLFQLVLVSYVTLNQARNRTANITKSINNFKYIEFISKAEAQHYGLSTPSEGRHGIYVRITKIVNQKQIFTLKSFIFLPSVI